MAQTTRFYILDFNVDEGNKYSMKLWRWFIKCPILFLLLLGWFGLTAFTWSEGRMPQKVDKSLIENPVFTALLEPEEPDSILDDIDFEDDTDNTQNQTQKEETILAAAPKNQASDKGTETTKPNAEKKKNKENNSITEQEEEEVGVTRFREYKKKKTDSRYYSDPGKKALTTDFSYEKVDKSYFDDAVFIGDSRTVGMQDYSGLDNAQFFAKTGMNVYDILEDEFLTDPQTGKEVSVAHMLKNNQYGKIYFMVGINELGTGNTGTFQKAYERVIKKFQKWQPNAVIYIQGIIPVSKKKAASDEIFNNLNINDKNVAIAQLADGKDIFYLDVSKSLTDKSGHLKADYTFDEVHMYAQYYKLWTDYLMSHAVVRKK